MAEFSNSSIALVSAGQNVPLTETAVNSKPCIVHRQGAGVVTLRGLRNAVTAHRSAKNAAPPLASPVFSSARFAVPLLPAAQRFSVVTLLGPNNAVPTRTRVAPSATASG